jgi:hypothetical protein
MRSHDSNLCRDEEKILDLLYQLATWHALAKLRMHTSQTLQYLDHATTSLGNSLRHFRDEVCPNFQKKERVSVPTQKGKQAALPTPNGSIPQESSKQKQKPHKEPIFSLSTFKVHSLGDYVDCIRRHGTTDSYSTQPVSISSTLAILLTGMIQGEAEHKICKLMFPRTRKQRDTYTQELTKLDTLTAHMERIEQQLEERESRLKEEARSTLPEDEDSSSEADSDVEGDISVQQARSMKEYHIGVSRKQSKHLPSWLAEHGDDPAFQVCLLNVFHTLLIYCRTFFHD